VAIALVRELGPTLTGILVAGRSASGIASELGSDAGHGTGRCHARYGDGPQPQVGNATGAGGNFDVAVADGAERFHRCCSEGAWPLFFSLRLNAGGILDARD